MNATSEILQIADSLSDMASKPDFKPLDALMKAAEEVGKSWSGSWLGYHARVYYKDLQPVPPGARFSKEWGMMGTFSRGENLGEWAEYEFDGVVSVIHEMAGDPKCDKIDALGKKAMALFEESQARLLSLLSPALQDHSADTFLKDTVDKIKKRRVFTASEFARHFAPSGQQMSRDINAIQAGFQTPPHYSVLAEVGAKRSPFTACDEVGKLARRIASHLEHLDKRERREARVGTNVFIGHGRSQLWKDLKEFIQDRLHLPWDEFNRMPVAGVANTTRLSRMLDEAAIAFLIMTGEDELADGKTQARMNVVHEVGLFQGRLGFEKAIVLLEDGCEEFSNISGLGQIRFPKGSIGTVFEEIRRVLEREHLIED
jgi:predicted nucleotide-binding protein